MSECCASSAEEFDHLNSERGEESWRKVFREGFAPGLTTRALRALRDALAGDDARLIQGATTSPPPLMCVQDWRCEAGCLIGFCYMQDGFETVGEVEAKFAEACFNADARLGEPAACRYLLNWYDETPRDQMRRDLLAEVDAELGRRQPERVAA